MFFTTTITWEAPSIGTKVLYLGQIIKKRKENNKIDKGKRLDLEKLDVKSFLYLGTVPDSP